MYKKFVYDKLTKLTGVGISYWFVGPNQLECILVDIWWERRELSFSFENLWENWPCIRVFPVTILSPDDIGLWSIWYNFKVDSSPY